MTEQALADAILRNSLEILRLTAGEQSRVDQVMVELARELRDLVATGRLNSAQAREVNALIRQAEEIITLGYQRAGATVDTYALAVVVAEKTQEIIEDAIPATVRLPSDALLLQLGKDVLIDGVAVPPAIRARPQRPTCGVAALHLPGHDPPRREQ